MCLGVDFFHFSLQAVRSQLISAQILLCLVRFPVLLKLQLSMISSFHTILYVSYLTSIFHLFTFLCFILDFFLMTHLWVHYFPLKLCLTCAYTCPLKEEVPVMDSFVGVCQPERPKHRR